MAGFTLVITPKLQPAEALLTAGDIEKWFKANPKRRVCRTDRFVVKRGEVALEIIKHTALPKDATRP